jgi:hypothetical protein
VDNVGAAGVEAVNMSGVRPRLVRWHSRRSKVSHADSDREDCEDSGSFRVYELAPCVCMTGDAVGGLLKRRLICSLVIQLDSS